MYDWGDLKFFLATARRGSTLAAARELGVNQTTIARRIAALETALSIRLVDRNLDGYRLTEAGATILAQAERVANEAEAVERLVEQGKRDFSGVIRVTAPAVFAEVVLTPWLSEFIDIYPNIKIEVIAAEQFLDLARGEADIAIRGSRLPREPGILVRKLVDCPWGLYCSRAYAAKRGAPACEEELNDHLLIGADGRLSARDWHVWLRKAAPRASWPRLQHDLHHVGGDQDRAWRRGFALRDRHGAKRPHRVFPDAGLRLQLLSPYPGIAGNVPRVKAFNKLIVARACTLRRLQSRPP